MTERPPIIPDSRVFNAWYRSAGVRHDARRVLDLAEDVRRDFFPAHLVPHLMHPVVCEADPRVRRYLAAQHLFQYLRFTAQFETRVVNRATERIANGRTGLDLPAHTRQDAFKIYVDEGYHALYSMDVQEQISGAAGLIPLPYDFTPSLTRLDAVGHEFDQHRELIHLLQVVVFETLITSLLDRLPDDPATMHLVRDTVRDHAEDERRHHAYFNSFFKHLWGGLDPATRRLVAPFLPALIDQSLQPRTDMAYDALVAAGFPPGIARDVIADAYAPADVAAEIRRSSAKTVRLFRQCDVLDLPGVEEAFEQLGRTRGVPHAAA